MIARVRWMLLALTAVSSVTGSPQHNPSILEDARVHPTVDGSFGFLYRTQDGIAHAAKGDPGGAVHGRFTYTDPTGLKVNYNYNAGAQAVAQKQQEQQYKQPVAPAAPRYNPPAPEYEDDYQQPEYDERPRYRNPAPAPRRYEPAPRRYEPAQSRYEPAQSRYEPAPNRYDPSSSRYQPKRYNGPAAPRYNPPERYTRVHYPHQNDVYDYDYNRP